MRNLVKTVLLIAPVFLFSRCSNNETKWQKFNANEGGFTIDMPSPVTKSEKQIPFFYGKQIVHFYTWKPATFEIQKFKLFQVSYANCPARTTSDTNYLRAVLDSAIELRKKDFTEKTEIESEDIDFNGYMGRAFFYDGGGNTLVTVKEFIANSRLYDLTIISNKNYPTANEANNFFNSIQVSR